MSRFYFAWNSHAIMLLKKKLRAKCSTSLHCLLVLSSGTTCREKGHVAALRRSNPIGSIE